MTIKQIKNYCMKHPDNYPTWVRCVVPNFHFQNTGKQYYLQQKDYKDLIGYIKDENYTSRFEGYNNCRTTEWTPELFDLIKDYPNLIELFILSSKRSTLTNTKNRTQLLKLIEHKNTNLTLLFMKIGMDNMLKNVLPLFFENENLVTDRVKKELEDFIEETEEYEIINVNFVVYASVLCDKDLTGCLNEDNIDNSNYFISDTFDRIQSLIPTKMMKILYDRLFDMKLIEGQAMFDFLWETNGRVQYYVLKNIVSSQSNYKYLTSNHITRFDKIIKKHPKTVAEASTILYNLNPSWSHLTKFICEPEDMV